MVELPSAGLRWEHTKHFEPPHQGKGQQANGAARQQFLRSNASRKVAASV
jgi:hypothetical protein